MKKQIPNLLTLCNLICGVMAAYQASQGWLHRAAVLMALGIVFDFLDGFAARLLKVQSPMGKELDSLADIVTSGVAPGIILYSIFRLSRPFAGVADPIYWLRFLGFLLPAFAAYRLAKFNLDERQSHSFLGLPVPSNALIWAAVGTCFIHPDWAQVALLPIPGIRYYIMCTIGLVAIAALSIVTDVLMVSEVPMLSLKFTSFGWKENNLKYILLLGAAVLIALFGIIGIALSIVWYILLSILTQRRNA
jgi:CDP-diacylglycerol--serine O-phosphatidyltransferase